MHFVPEGTIGILDLLQSIVAFRHGKQAVAPAEVWNDEKGEIYVTRGGGETSYKEDVARWESVRNEMHDALRTGELIAMVLPQNGRINVPLVYWDMFVAERSLWDGKLQNVNSSNVDLAGLSIFMDSVLVHNWLRGKNEEHSNLSSGKATHAAVRPLTKAEAEDKYKKRVKEWLISGKNPSRDEDEKWAREYKISRSRIREMRANLAPSNWTTTGPRTVSK